MWIVAFSTLPYCPRWSVSYQWRVFHPMHCGTHCACKPPRREFLCRPVNSRPINSRPIPNVPQGLRTAFGPKTRHRHVLPCCWSSLAERSSSFIRPTGVVVISQGRWGFTAAFCVLRLWLAHRDRTADHVPPPITTCHHPDAFLQDGVFYVHFFLLGRSRVSRQAALQYHGTAIPPSRFRSDDTDFPNVALVNWHYQQCLKARIRGFSVRMGEPAVSP